MSSSSLPTTRLLPACALLLGTACGSDKLLLESGSYTLWHAELGSTGVAPDSLAVELSVDVDAKTVVLVDAAGTETTASLDSLPSDEWMSGCPGNLDYSRMEVARLGASSLDAGNLYVDLGPDIDGVGTVVTLSGPVLLASCAYRGSVDLRDRPSAGDLGVGGTGCTGAEICLIFEPR